MMNWLVKEWHWPAASLFAGCALLMVAPVWWATAELALTLCYVQLPMYMVHQWEEHTGDRFRRYINQTLADGREVLTPMATFWINSLGVWAVDLTALYLACFVDLSLGLAAAYLPVVNGVGHIVQALVRREYNPGLWTSVLLFLPIGGWGVYEIGRASGADWLAHAVGIGVAVGVHVAIIAHVARRLARLRAEVAPS